LTKVLINLRLNLTSPTKRQVAGIFYHCNFAEILFASMFLGKKYMMPFLLQVTIVRAKQAKLELKKISLINIFT